MTWVSLEVSLLSECFLFFLIFDTFSVTVTLTINPRSTFHYGLTQCGKQSFSENRSAGIWFTSRARQTHRQTNCGENITHPRFRGGVKMCLLTMCCIRSVQVAMLPSEWTQVRTHWTWRREHPFDSLQCESTWAMGMTVIWVCSRLPTVGFTSWPCRWAVNRASPCRVSRLLRFFPLLPISLFLNVR